MSEEFETGQPEGLRVVTAGNPGPMTGRGTNTFIVGEQQLAIIDPGPMDAAHLLAIKAAIPKGGSVSHIIVTHAHRDHSSLADRLSGAVDAPVFAFAKGGNTAGMGALGIGEDELMGGEGIDPAFQPHRLLDNAARLSCAEWTLEVLHTPGHLDDHICLCWSDRSIVFTGDHVMGWSSTFVSPPEGSMTDYMRSLNALEERKENHYFPAHGGPISDGKARVRKLRSHRLSRESSLLSELRQGPLTLGELTGRVYTDTPSALHAAAARNVLAHLIDLLGRKLVGTGKSGQSDRVFHLE